MAEEEEILKSKIEKLDSILRELNPFVIAFSGGVDSSFLMHRGKLLGIKEMTGVTIRTPYIPSSEIAEASEFAKKYNIKHKILDFPFPEKIRMNPVERCYYCKKSIFSNILKFARDNGFRFVVDGTNADDKFSYRPGIRALKELGIKSPLLESGLTKNDIRAMLKEQGLPLWGKPAMACLLTRIPYDTRITDESLRMVENAEKYLSDLGFQGSRVRIHGDLARIECLPGQMEKMVVCPVKELIISNLKKLGFRFISLDLEGYRSGSADPER
jgi:uncharacterized protein